MSEMLERVARGLYANHWSALPEGSRPAWPGDSGPEYWLWQARAAIGAMREPTEEMALYGRSGIGGEPDSRADTVEAAIDCWQAMIDAALA